MASESVNSIEPATYKDIILNCRLPTILRRVPLKWPCLDNAQLPIESWAAHFDADTRYVPNGGPQFHFGRQMGGRQSQWEISHSTGSLPVSRFIRDYGEPTADTVPIDQTKWASFSYRNLSDMPAECRRDIGLAALGFERRSIEDFTFWLGSRGTHTPCHYDTYGCNVVVQVYGSKSWLLMPPSAALTVTRVPYEESSVYCAENFFSPSPADVDGDRYAAIAADVRRIILQPGDVLIVPPKWWHYAECQTISLSVNSWIPLDSDLDAHMDECIVRANVTEYTRHLNQRLQAALINPNELSNNMYDTPLPDQLRLLGHIAKYLHTAEARQTWPVPSFRHNYLGEVEAKALIDEQESELVCAVRKLTVEDFRQLLRENATRYDEKAADHQLADETVRSCADFINATCSPEQVERIKQTLLHRE